MTVRVVAAADVVDVRADKGRDVGHGELHGRLALHPEGVDGRRYVGVDVGCATDGEVALHDGRRSIRQKINGADRGFAVKRQTVEVEVVFRGHRTVFRVARTRGEGGAQRDSFKLGNAPDREAVGVCLRREIRAAGADAL